MSNVDTILAALDLEGGSAAVLARAVQLADAHEARLAVLHVVEADALDAAAAAAGSSEGELRGRLERQACEAFDVLLTGIAPAAVVELQVRFGAPHATIIRAAEELRADLVLVGPGGRAGASRARLLGSTADRVVRTVAAPLLVVRSRLARPYRQVAVAVDFSEQSAAAIRAARALAPQAGLHLVHAVDVPHAFQQAMLRAGASHAEIERFRAGKATRARVDLAALAGTPGDAGGIATRVLKGDPGAALVRLSKGGRIDLLAMGAHGRGAVLQALLGSATRRVLAEAGCDVLVAGR